MGEIIMKALNLVPIIALVLAGNVLTGCESNDGPAEKAGEKIDNAIEDTSEKIDNTVEETGEEIEEAADKLREKTQ
jgi:predicted small secreted protein